MAVPAGTLMDCAGTAIDWLALGSTCAGMPMVVAGNTKLGASSILWNPPFRPICGQYPERA